jgi:hypothetical protein
MKDIYNSIGDISKLGEMDISFYNTELYMSTFITKEIKIDDARDIHRKLVLTLSSMLISVANTIKFVRYIVTAIFNMERMSSFPNRFKKSIVQSNSGDQTEQQTDEYKITSADDIDNSNFDPFGLDDAGFDEAEVFTDMDENH